MKFALFMLGRSFLFVILAFGFFNCGGGEDPTPSPPEEVEVIGPTAPTQEETPAPEEASDIDDDDIPDVDDNCVNLYNPNQVDTDGDKVGDACDNCDNVSNPDQANFDSDSLGDACDDDDDADGFPETGEEPLENRDLCPFLFTESNTDFDGDGLGDACDTDDDNDGVADDRDNCLHVRVFGFVDIDGDGLEDVCDDSDADGIFDDTDNCRTIPNPDQDDGDEDGVGDDCDSCLEGDDDACPANQNSLVSGYSHNCRIKTDGIVSCWGYSGITLNAGFRDRPFKFLDAGFNHTCGLLVHAPTGSSNLKCWGRSFEAVPSSSSLGSQQFKQVSTGRYHTCAVLTGLPASGSNLKCWNVIEEVEPYPDDPYSGYTIIRGPTDEELGNLLFSKVEVSRRETCALLDLPAGGRTNLMCWGLTPDFSSIPLEAVPFFTDIKAANYNFCGLLTAESTSAGFSNILCFGSPTFLRDYPMPAEFAGLYFGKIAVGDETVCALLAETPADGSNLRCWGDLASFPSPEDLGDAQFKEVSVGDGHVCALSESLNEAAEIIQTVRCWGGRNTIYRPDEIGDIQFDKISLGYNHFCGLILDPPEGESNLRCWESREFGDYADSRFSDLGLPSDQQFSNVFAEERHTCALLAEAPEGETNIRCWGDSDYIPTELLESSEQFRWYSQGIDHYCTLLRENPSDSSNLQCWGYRSSYLLDPENEYFPSEEELGTLQLSRVITGRNHTCGFLEDPVAGEGNVRCWGDSDEFPRSFQPSESELFDLEFIDFSSDYAFETCALLDLATLSAGETNLRCWLSSGDIPEEIRSRGLIFSQVVADYFHTCGLIDEDFLDFDEGNVYCWGGSVNGEATVPERFRNERFRFLATGYNFTCGLLETPEAGQSNLVCWGLGDGRLLAVPPE